MTGNFAFPYQHAFSLTVLGNESFPRLLVNFLLVSDQSESCGQFG